MEKKIVDFNQIMARPPRCPLCLKPMELAYDSVRAVKVLVCHKDRIAISVMDPLVGHWEERREKIPCPNCNADMRIFFTSTGYMKAKCMKKGCGCMVEGSNPDRHTMAPALSLDGIANTEGLKTPEVDTGGKA